MKSKIFFDIDSNNQPIIKTSIFFSDDIRDKVAERCMDNACNKGIKVVENSYTQGLSFIFSDVGGVNQNNEHYHNYIIYPTIEQVPLYLEHGALKDLQKKLEKALSVINERLDNKQYVKGE